MTTSGDLNTLLDEIDRRLFELESYLNSPDGLGNNNFGSINIVDPTTGNVLGVVDTHVSPPTGLTIIPGVFYNDVFADVSWTAPADGSAIAYDIEWAKRDGSPGSYTYELINATRVHGNSFRIPALEAHTWYGVRISGINRAGFISSTTPATGFTDFQTTVDASVPVAPVGLVVAAGLKSLVVRWTDNAEPDVAMGAGTYLVQVATDNAFTAIVKQEFVSGTVATFVDLNSNTTYYVRVYAIDQSGNQSPPSATATGTTGQAVSQDLMDGAVIATKLSAGSANLIMDSSFEGSNLTRYWINNGGWARSTTAPFHGTAKALYTTTRTANTWEALQQTVNIQPGSPLTITFKYDMSANMRQSHLKLDFYDVSNVGVGSAWFPLGGTNGPIGTTTVTQSSTAPAGAVKAVVSVMGGWSSDGAAATFSVDGIYLCSQASLPTGVTWAPAGPEIMPAMIFGDMIVANAIQVWNMSANSVGANQIIANSIVSNHIAVVGLDAGVILFGTMSGGRIDANSADINVLTTSTLTSANITLNGGSFKAGNPPTTGVLINSQGIRLYSGGSAVVTLDSGGTATFSGTLTSSTINSSTISSPTLTGGTITGTTLRTAVSGNSGGWVEIGTANVATVWIHAGNSDESVAPKMSSSYFSVGGGNAQALYLNSGWPSGGNSSYIELDSRSATNAASNIYISSDSVTVYGTFNNFSSIVGKRKVSPVDNNYDSLKLIKQMNPVRYKRENDPNGKWSYSLVAEELQKILPDLVVPVQRNHDEFARVVDEMQLTIKTLELIPFLIDAIKQLDGRLANLEARVPLPVIPTH